MSPVALVTGASRGLGAAAAARLARDGYGVAVCHEPNPVMAELASGVVAGIRNAGADAEAFEADLANPAQVSGLVGEVTARFGGMDAIVSNAAVDRVVDWESLDTDEWDHTMNVNVRATWLLAKAAAPSLRSSANASITTVSSIMAATGATGRMPYSTSKEAIVGLTRVLARTLGPDGVRVNCIMPGAIRTESETERFSGVDDEVIAMQSIKRRGTADDVAGVFSFLAGADSGFITGQVICVDGGWVML